MDRDQLPLGHVRVLDVSGVMPGPFATQILADLGACVLKVERPPHGEPLRGLFKDRFDSYNRGKASIGLDLRDEGDRALFLDLAAGADVLVEGFRPGVMQRLGLGFEAVAARQARILYASISGYGQDGPYAHDPSHNSNYLALTGAFALSGDPGGPPMESFAVPVAGEAGGLYAAIAIVSALAAPERRARHLDVSLLGASLALAAQTLAEYRGRGATHRDDIMARPASGIYRTGDGGYINIMAVEDEFWVALCGALERPDLAAREDLARNADRWAHYGEITAAIETALASGTREEWTERLRAHGVPATPVLEPEEVPNHAAVRHLGLLHLDPTVFTAFPVKGLPSKVSTSAPEFDEHGPAIRQHGWAALLAEA